MAPARVNELKGTSPWKPDLRLQAHWNWNGTGAFEKNKPNLLKPRWAVNLCTFITYCTVHAHEHQTGFISLLVNTTWLLPLCVFVTQVFLWVHIKLRFSASSPCQFNRRAGSNRSFSPPPPLYPTSLTYTGSQPRSYTVHHSPLLLCSTTPTRHYTLHTYFPSVYKELIPFPIHIAAAEEKCCTICVQLSRSFVFCGNSREKNFDTSEKHIKHSQMFHVTHNKNE